MKTYYSNYKFLEHVPCAQATRTFGTELIHHELEFKTKKRQVGQTKFWLEATPYLVLACDRIKQPHICTMRLILIRRDPKIRLTATGRYYDTDVEWNRIYPCEEVMDALSFYQEFKKYDLKPYLMTSVL